MGCCSEQRSDEKNKETTCWGNRGICEVAMGKSKPMTSNIAGNKCSTCLLISLITASVSQGRTT